MLADQTRVLGSRHPHTLDTLHQLGCWTGEAGDAASAAAMLDEHLLAKTVTTLDVVSAGRAILGIGAGWFQLEHDALGFEFGTFTDRLVRLEEALQIIVPMLAGERPTYLGGWYRVSDAINEPRLPERIPVMLGGSGEKEPSGWRRDSPTTSTSCAPKISSPTRWPCSPTAARNETEGSS